MAATVTSQDRSPAFVSRVLLVDDHPLVRHGLAQLLAQQPDLQICGEADSPASALALAEQTHPQLVITDLSLKDGSGLTLIAELRAKFPDIKVLVSSIHDDALYADRVLQAGAMGYVNKQNPTRNLLDAIRKVLQGGIAVSPEVMERLLSRTIGTTGATGIAGNADQNPVSRLSNRELEVFSLLGRGLTTREIAERIGVRPKTVETYRENIKGKLNLRNGTELLRHAVQWVMEHPE